MTMQKSIKEIRLAAKFRSIAAGLAVRATVWGATNDYHFANADSRDDFIQRVKVNGGKCQTILA